MTKKYVKIVKSEKLNVSGLNEDHFGNIVVKIKIKMNEIIEERLIHQVLLKRII